MTEPVTYPEPISPYVTDEANILHDIRDEIAILNSAIKDIQAKMEKVETMTAEIIAEVKPTIDEFMNSSLGKMLGVGKKK